MNERNKLDVDGCLFIGLIMAVIFLFIATAIDTWAGRRDMHHIQDLQRRVGQLEQRKGLL